MLVGSNFFLGDDLDFGGSFDVKFATSNGLYFFSFLLSVFSTSLSSVAFALSLCASSVLFNSSFFCWVNRGGGLSGRTSSTSITLSSLSISGSVLTGSSSLKGSTEELLLKSVVASNPLLFFDVNSIYVGSSSSGGLGLSTFFRG